MHALSTTLAVLLVACSSSSWATKCSVPADVYFDPGSRETSATQMTRAIEPVDRVKRNNTVLAVLIVGHADLSEGTRERQLQLSIDRARGIAEYVVGTYPELKDVIHLEGKGATQPMSHIDALLNRRVDIEVMCAVTGETAATQDAIIRRAPCPLSFIHTETCPPDRPGNSAPSI